MIRALLSLPILTASEIAGSVSDMLFDLGATVAGSNLRK